MSGTTLKERASPAAPPPQTKGKRLKKRFLEEVASLIPAFFFFSFLFSLLWLTQTVILAEHHLHTLPPSRVLIGSVIVAKGLLLIDIIPVLKKLEARVVLVGAFWKTWCYFVVLIFFQYLETLFDRRHEGWAAGNRMFWLSVGEPAFWVLQLWLIVSLFAFSATRSLVQKLGRQRFRELLIGR
jgi:hypothetical protein